MIDFKFLNKFDLSYDYLKYDFLTNSLIVRLNAPHGLIEWNIFVDNEFDLISDLRKLGFELKSIIPYKVDYDSYDYLIFRRMK